METPPSEPKANKPDEPTPADLIQEAKDRLNGPDGIYQRSSPYLLSVRKNLLRAAITDFHLAAQKHSKPDDPDTTSLSPDEAE